VPKNENEHSRWRVSIEHFPILQFLNAGSADAIAGSKNLDTESSFGDELIQCALFADKTRNTERDSDHNYSITIILRSILGLQFHPFYFGIEFCCGRRGLIPE
jgi:hypothetical protein